jgi:hypothetical protein
MPSRCGWSRNLTIAENGTTFLMYEKVTDHAGICQRFDGCLCAATGNTDPGACGISRSANSSGDACTCTGDIEKRKSAGG